MSRGVERPVIVCLCGSTRFKAEFLAAQRVEALAGRVVLAPGVYSHADGIGLSTDALRRLAGLHRRKIELADELLVIAPEGVIGEATRGEINYARRLGKPIRYWSERVDPAAIDPLDALRESHVAQRLVTNEIPGLDVPDVVKELRCALIEEEAAEFRTAVEENDIVGVADAIADLLYVTYGAALTFGIPIREVFAEVHRSNMTKLDDEGNPVYRDDGKVMKGPNFSAPSLMPLLAAAGYRPPATTT
jgi:predicted HAD superfamily Cof-like phosphohydrolase